MVVVRSVLSYLRTNEEFNGKIRKLGEDSKICEDIRNEFNIFSIHEEMK